MPGEKAAGRARGRGKVAAALLAAGFLTGCAFTPQPSAPVPAPQAATRPDPAGMIGTDSAALQRLFGPPRLVRRDAPAELWQYQTRDCVVDLFLYQEKDGLRLAYLEARTGAAQVTAPRPCVDAVLASREKPVSS
jgi:hypothetical protein